MNQYDLCVVGAGIAGMYAGYEWRKQNPTGRIIFIEAGEHAGGRIATAHFCGVDIPLGAGVGRTDKDVKLAALLRELHIPVHTFEQKVQYGDSINSLKMEDVQALRNAVISKEAFGGFAKRVLGQSSAKGFIESMGFTDMIRENALEVMQHYGIDDNFAESKKFVVPWALLTRALLKAIGPRRFLYNTQVISLSQTPEQLFCVTTPHGQLCARKIVVATTLPSLKALFPRVREYRCIDSQPFLRVYAKFPASLRPFLASVFTSFTVVKPPLQNIIPINADKGIYMIAYSDNAYADQLVDYKSDTPGNRQYFSRLVEKSIGIPPRTLTILRLYSKYWDVGTHFIKPSCSVDEAFFQRAQHPLPGVVVVGEVVSAQNRGWVEGALESVDAVVADL